MTRLCPLLLANFDYIVGGGEIGLLMLAEGLRQRGHRPLVVVPGSGGLGKQFERHAISTKPKQAARELAEIAGDCDVIHTFSERGMQIAVAAGTGKPLLFHVLVPNPHPLDDILAKDASVVICNSRATARRFGERRNLVVVYNGVPVPRPVEGNLLPRHGRKTIAIVGGTVPRKGQLDALPAIQKVQAARVDVDLVLVGRIGGAVGRRLMDAATASDGRIRLLGFIPDIADRLAEFSLVLVPSRSEGFGRVAVEALRAGVPVLATRVEGLVEALSGLEDPWLPERMEHWGARILRELERPTYSPNELRAAAARFDPENYLRSILRLYRELT